MASRNRLWIVRCTLLFLAGAALQFSLGSLRPSFLTYPWGVVLAVNYLYVLILLYASSDRYGWITRLYDRPARIEALASVLVLTLLFGLIRQDADTGGLAGKLGFTQMSASWVFVLFLFRLMTVLGLQAVDDVCHWKRKKPAAVMLHAAFFLVLSAGFFGSGDKVKMRVTAALGVPVHAGVSHEGKSLELPFRMTLKEFSLEEYPARIHLTTAGGALSDDFVELDADGKQGRLNDWQVCCLNYLEEAGRVTDEAGFVAMKHVGAASAAYLRACHLQTKQTVSGWVSCGSHIFRGCGLLLPDGGELVMPRREVKKYLSVIEVEGEEGSRRLDIEVNRPGRFGAWNIYQAGYDSVRGKWSTLSVFECVRDGWYTPVRIALWMILAASGWLFIGGHIVRHRKGEERR